MQYIPLFIIHYYCNHNGSCTLITPYLIIAAGISSYETILAVSFLYKVIYSALNFHESIGHAGTDGIRICNLSHRKRAPYRTNLIAIQERLKLWELILFLNIYSLGGYWKWKWPDQQLGGAQKCTQKSPPTGYCKFEYLRGYAEGTLQLLWQ